MQDEVGTLSDEGMKLVADTTNVVIPEGADLATIAAAVGVQDDDAAPELDTSGVDYQAARPPYMQVMRAFLVMCAAPSCGIVAARDKRVEADAAMAEHRARHIAINKKAEATLAKFRNELYEKEMARRAAEGDEVETKGIELTQLDKQPVDRVVEEVVPDRGCLDWQFGSPATGRDPNKMWHRGCGGEVIIVENAALEKIRECQHCGEADTPSGELDPS